MDKLALLKTAELGICPFCDSAVELHDCTANTYGWRGFRILCRECNLIMYSAYTGTTLTPDGTVDGMTPEKALEGLLRRWGAKLPEALWKAAT